MARWARWQPAYLLHPWGRPGFTIPHAAIAWLGEPSTAWHLCRLFSAAVTAAAALIAARVAGKLNVRPAWAVVALCYAQPLCTILATTTLTETLAAFYLVTAVGLLLSSRPIMASAVFSVALVTRFDVAALLIAWWPALWLQPARRANTGVIRLSARAQRTIAAAVSMWAPLLFSLLCLIVLDVSPFRLFLTPSGSRDYAATHLLAYVPQLLLAIPPVIAAAALVGAARLDRNRVWLAALPAVFVLTHLLIRALGAYASGGFARFMVVIAPLVAILAQLGLSPPRHVGRGRIDRIPVWLAAAAVLLVGLVAVLFERRAGRLPWRPAAFQALLIATIALAAISIAAALASRPRWRRRLGTVAAASLGLALVAQWMALVRPLRRPEHARSARDAVAWLRSEGLAERPIFAATPWVAHELNQVESPFCRKSRRLLASMPAGAIILWEPVYAPNDFHGVPLSVITDDPAYRLLRTWPLAGADAAGIQAFEKLRPTPLPEADPPSYPPDVMGRRDSFWPHYTVTN